MSGMWNWMTGKSESTTIAVDATNKGAGGVLIKESPSGFLGLSRTQDMKSYSVPHREYKNDSTRFETENAKASLRIFQKDVKNQPVKLVTDNAGTAHRLNAQKSQLEKQHHLSSLTVVHSKKGTGTNVNAMTLADNLSRGRKSSYEGNRSSVFPKSTSVDVSSSARHNISGSKGNSGARPKSAGSFSGPKSGGKRK